jgi:D-glycero-D-manno-heptose 1,7-bisphosphate phosphatase
MGDPSLHLDAVLFDRDGTLVVDVPYNADPAAVEPMPTAPAALSLLRRAGVALGVVSNQSGIGRGILTDAQVESVNARIDALLGPFDVWEYCPHLPEARCDCRKPLPGLIERACRRLGVDPSRVAVIGDIGTDVEAARAAGCAAILVPTAVTRADEIAQAPLVARDLAEAAAMVLDGSLIEGSRP